jgi:hypothetical protein
MFYIDKDTQRVRRIVTVETEAPDFIHATVVAGFREMRSTAGRRPGPEWRPDPKFQGDSRKWLSYKAVIKEGVMIRREDITPEYPRGAEKYQFGRETYDGIVRPIVKSAIDARPARRRKVPLSIREAVVDNECERAGVPKLEPEELESIVASIQKEITEPNAEKREKARRAIVADGRTIVPAQKEPPVEEPPVEEPPVEEPPVEDSGSAVEKREKENSRWSDSLSMVVNNNEDGDLFEEAVAVRGWPIPLVADAKRRVKGAAGVTLAFAAKTNYNPDKHGTVKSHEIETGTSE